MDMTVKVKSSPLKSQKLSDASYLKIISAAFKANVSILFSKSARVSLPPFDAEAINFLICKMIYANSPNMAGMMMQTPSTRKQCQEREQCALFWRLSNAWASFLIEFGG